MLTLLEYGWAKFSIGDAKYSLSYLSYGLIDWLEEAVHGLKHFRPFIFHGWCEPEEIFCTVTKDFCYVICADEGEIFETHAVKMTILDFCKELHADISKDVEAWARFDCYGEESKSLLIETEQKIQSLLDELAALISKRAADWGAM